MSSSFEAMTSLPVQNRPSLEVAISKMVDEEVQDRRDRKTAMYLKISKLRYTALLEDVICGTDRNFTKDDLAAIADCAFILVANASKIELKGDSMRQKLKK